MLFCTNWNACQYPRAAMALRCSRSNSFASGFHVLLRTFRINSGVTRYPSIYRELAPSKFVRDIFRMSDLGLDPTVLPHFVPSVARIPAQADPPERSYYFVASRLEKPKGIQTILPLFREG